jgi:phenylacetate-CoA ligase
MPLHRYEREGIERAFATRVFDRYASEELGVIATECEAHAGLHVDTEALLVEIVDDGSAHSTGRVVVTDLRNRGMPFIRYDLADRATLSTRVCPCGRTYPLLERILGRLAAHLYTPRGEMVEGVSLTEHFSELGADVQQVQVVQDRLDHLTIRVVPAQGFGDSARERIAAVVRERFGADMTHDLELVERIPQDKSGKYRFAICALPEDEKRRLESRAVGSFHRSSALVQNLDA